MTAKYDIALVLIAFLFLLTLAPVETPAQASKPASKFSAFRDDPSSPFKDGKTVISAVRYDGLDFDHKEYSEHDVATLYESDLRRALGDESKSIADGEVFIADKVGQALVFLKKWLAERGFLTATVVVLGETQPKGKMNLIFSVDRGGPFFVSAIRFTGTRNVTNEELVADLRKCLGNRRPVFDRRLYEYCANKDSLSVMRKHGFFKAKIREVRSRIFQHSYDITIDVDEGVRYRWGAIKIKGNTVFSEKEILEMMGQTSGDIADGKELRDFVFDRLQRAYAEKGFVQYTAEFDPVYSDPPGEGLDSYVDVVLTIEEGRKFTFRNIVFTRVADSESQRLKDEFPLKAGDVFVRSRLDAGIKTINSGKRFYPIDGDNDVELRTDDKSGDVDIVIALKKIDE